MKINRLSTWAFFAILFFCFPASSTGISPPALSETLSCQPDEAPVRRGIFVAPRYPGVVVPPGRYVITDLIVENRGTVSESVFIFIPNVPEGWEALIRTYAYEVTGVLVPPGETRTLSLVAKPGRDVEPGEYVFPIRALSEDGEVTASSQLLIRTRTAIDTGDVEGVILSAPFPVLEGPTGARFEFSLDVENRLDMDVTYSLSAGGPENWEVRFKPAYEDKYISSLHIRAGQSRSLAVEVRPDRQASPGRHSVPVELASEHARVEAELVVELSGTHGIEVVTSSGLLSLSARQGEKTGLSLYVENSGSAVQRDIRFLSFKPENWEVTFAPDSIDTLEPGEIRQVEMHVTPDGRAIVGDYSLRVSVQGERAFKGLELRVTVRASAVWGWVGAALILFVIAGLSALYIHFGRR